MFEKYLQILYNTEQSKVFSISTRDFNLHVINTNSTGSTTRNCLLNILVLFQH